jgi:class 3 adenylate cyclase/ActR/RegA family two-component response regulator
MKYPAKILVVDDEPDLEILIKQKFRKKIREEEYRFVFAAHGKHALELLEKHPDIDIVLSDINMPEMDGLTLLSRLRDDHSLLKSVVVSAYGDMDNIRTAMNRGAFDFITKPVNFKDLEITIDKTIKYVRQIKNTLVAIRENNILRMYVDETVLSFMSSKEYEQQLLQNEIVNGTVAFIDICGFTSFSESRQPNEVVGLLNTYFDLMVKEIIRFDGQVDKFIGDALMAVFKGKYDLDRALDASRAIRKRIRELSANASKGEFYPEVSIGINSGEMLSGNIGSETLKRLTFTVIGDVVNTAARLQALAEPGQVLITGASHKNIRESFKCRKLESIPLKNKSKVVELYEVLE